MMRRKTEAGTPRKIALTLAVAAIAACVAFIVRNAAATGEASEDGANAGDEVARLIDSALYTRAEFFGAQARVPYPTAEARNRLASLRERRPDEPRLLLPLARLDEKLGRYETAEAELSEYASRAGRGLDALEELAEFQHRRALFDREAATLEAMLRAAPDGAREQLLGRLVRLAESQKLEAYLKPEFFERVIAERPADFRVAAGYVDRLVEGHNASAALEAVRRYRERFPSHKRFFLQKEVSILDAAGRAREAEAVYVAAFDPFQPDRLSEKFYNFLREHDRFRAYGGELREAFRRDPADFRAAVKLFHFRGHAYEDTGGIFARVEAARAARGVEWTPDELATAARLLIKEGDGDAASRFLYTLVARGELKRGTGARAKVLYQLFELLSDARDSRLSLTRGDLRFYRDVAAADPHPGILGGLLSLIFSGESPAREMDGEDEEAVKFFNRAAAYRIFDAYREENPTSPELAQMYLDIVRLYSAEKEPKVAEAVLAEFERRYGDAPQYPEVALKLADCYVLLGRHEEERAVYARMLDYLGKHRDAKTPLVQTSSQTDAGSATEPTEVSPSLVEYPPKSNPGIKAGADESAASYDYGGTSYRDSLAEPEEEDAYDESEAADDESGAEDNSDKEHAAHARVTYADVLARAVASLAKENRTEEVLALYAAELKKYPAEQGLYEQMLQWLGQTNLFEEQSRVYKDALARFPGETWRDRLARWLLRRERTKEFGEFSRGLLDRLDDREAERYLEKFTASRAGANAESFESNLCLGLYSLAHERFPENVGLVRGLLKFHAARGRWDEYQRLLAEYYFVSPEIREQFLSHLSERGELRPRLESARETLKARGVSELDGGARPVVESLPYKLFRADASARVSDYEEAVDAYRELNRLYPSTPEFAERLISFTRSLGQRNRTFLEEAAAASRSLADAQASDAGRRTRAGEVYAELGDYGRARAEWARLVSLAPGDREAYLDAATVYWDYFQYADALATINKLRRETGDRAAYAFEAGAILEAQHRAPDAVAEYVKALDEGSPAHRRALTRLAALSRRKGVAALVAAAYSRERAQGSANVALGYASLLKEVDRWKDASKLLAAEVARSADADFVDGARGKFSESDDDAGERACLARLVRISKGPRQVISRSLQLAESYRGGGEPKASASVLRGLVKKFPANYGLLQEASNFYRRLGLDEDSLRVLRDAAARGNARYRRDFSRRLAARLIELNRLEDARGVLEGLHAEDPLDLGVFRELAHVYARARDAEAFKSSLSRTLEAVRATDAGPRELRGQTAELRRAAIGVFTQLRDYRAAMEQHVEIVNRDPDDDAGVDAAVAYAKRYGGADELLAYYKKTAALAFKNYRWDVVLARIYEAKGDPVAAARSYRRAIANQPEMVELHAALAEACVKSGDYDCALKALDKATELSNDDPHYVRRTAEVLERAGRKREAEEVRRRLPAPEAPKKENARDLFAEAERAAAGDRAKSVAQYREAFDALAADPYAHDLRASEVVGYARALRDAEGLDEIFERLWRFREKLVVEVAREGSRDAGRARAALGALDGALPDAVGATAAEEATGGELAPLYASLREKIDASLRAPDAYGTTALLQNVSRRAGFAALEGRLLERRMEAARGDAVAFGERLRALLNFYAAGGEYARAVELLEKEGKSDAARDPVEYASLLAEYARLAGDGAREMSALRSYYDAGVPGPASQTDALVARYLEALYASGPGGMDELRRRAPGASRHSAQLIDFLAAKGERELAHAAVAGSGLPAAWRLARDAQLSLALREFDSRGEAYFASALSPATIGELVGAKGGAKGVDDKNAAAATADVRSDGGARLDADDWSRLETDYGRWLYTSGNREARARAASALPAVIESRPRDAGAQGELARWYLSRGDARAALEHLRLAEEESPNDARNVADAGAAHFMLGERERAKSVWAKLVEGEEPSVDSCLLYLKTLAAHGLAREARARLAPTVAKRLKEAGAAYYAGRTKFEELKPLLHALSSSFGGASSDDDDEGRTLSVALEEERAAFFRRLCDAEPDDTELPQLVVEENLVARARLGQFYSLLVARSEESGSYDYDYEFTSFTQGAFGVADAEEAFDQSNEFRAGEPSGGRFKWERAYLEYLLEEHSDAEAEKHAAAIEKELERRYARPAWLRLARLRLELRGGRDANVFAALRRFTGGEVSGDLAKVSAPSAERLSEAVAMLREERRDAAVPRLLEATYAQALALGQYRASYFVALARPAFEGGDAARGGKLLRLMVELSEEGKKEEAAAEVASLPGVAERVAAFAHAEAPEESNGVVRAEALRLAAETAGAFGRYEEAAGFRAKLAEEKPDDYANRVELARLLAAAEKREEAAALLSQVVRDRHAPRAARWQAVWVAAEVTGGRSELWDSLAGGKETDNKGAGARVDVEMKAALKAAQLRAGGRAVEAADAFARVASDDPNPLSEFFLGVLESEAGRVESAESAFAAALRSKADAEIVTAFGSDEDGALAKLIRSQLSRGRRFAALKLASLDAQLTGARADEGGATEDEGEASGELTTVARKEPGYLTLGERASKSRGAATTELLGLLSDAAEKTGDLDKAIEFERARANRLSGESERAASLERVRRLERMRKEKAGAVV